MSVQIAFIGADERALAHWNTLRYRDVRCVGVCDAQAVAARALAKACAAPVFPSARALFQDVQPDAVWICLSPHAHRDAEILAAERGCAMLVEMPIAASLETVKRIRGALQTSRVLYVPSTPWRYDAAWIRARKYLQAPSQVLAQTIAPLLQTKTTRARKSEDFENFAAHAAPICDAIRVMGRGVNAVFAVSAGEENRFDLAVTLQLKNGVIGQWSLQLLPRAAPKTQWLLTHSSGSAWLESGRARIARGDEMLFWHDSEHGAQSGLAAQNRAFLDAVRNGKRAALLGTAADATHVLRVLLAIEKSLQTRQIVKLGRT